MLFTVRGARLPTFTLLVCLIGCGARSGLPGSEQGEGGAGQGGAGQGGIGQGGIGQGGTGQGGTGGEGAMGPCIDGEVIPCGTDVGACELGQRRCMGDTFGPCEGQVGPFVETCNDIDDDCDGVVDNGFGIGEACDGPDSDVCLDDVMTCAGCTQGPNNVEVCNGKDDNCNGIVDADCEVGDCQPILLVTGSTPSSPGCIDFPVEAGSQGAIQYPCGGGPVTAQLGSIQFTGNVQNGVVSLDGTATVLGPDGCMWKTDHHIGGNIPAGTLTYSYSEHVVPSGPPKPCWSPCTETGTVQIQWVATP